MTSTAPEKRRTYRRLALFMMLTLLALGADWGEAAS
jgi:hypothetical protein